MIGSMEQESEVMANELSGLSHLGDKVNPKEIIDAISGGIAKVQHAAKGESTEEISLPKVLLILGGGFLLYKILTANLRD